MYICVCIALQLKHSLLSTFEGGKEEEGKQTKGKKYAISSICEWGLVDKGRRTRLIKTEHAEGIQLSGPRWRLHQRR